jgi:hypothetical protein
MRLLRALLAATLLSSSLLLAQTYTPKTIRIDAPAGTDTAEPLRIATLQPGPVTKQEIEAALQRLDATGMYSAISYTVNSTVLVIKLTPLEDNNTTPVRYANFPWWDTKELEHLVETRVPGFHGELPLHSPTTDSVIQALEALAAEKSLQAKVSATGDPAHNAVMFRIDSPRIVVGDLKLSEEIHPTMGGNTASLERGMKGRDFDTLGTSETLVTDLIKIFSSGGYLDVKIDPPVFSAPHADGANYVVDASATIHRGEQYHVAAVTFEGAPAGTEGDLRKEADVKVGGPASPAAARLSNADLDTELAMHGYLAAESTDATTTNPPAHTVTYTFTLSPGALYHLSTIDASQASPEIQAAIARDSRLKPGVVIGRPVLDAITDDIHKYDPQKKQKLSTNIKRDTATSTAAIVLAPVVFPGAH